MKIVAGHVQCGGDHVLYTHDCSPDLPCLSQIREQSGPLKCVECSLHLVHFEHDIILIPSYTAKWASSISFML